MKNREKANLTSFFLFLLAAIAICFAGSTAAGDLEPTAPPGPTMKTLNEIPPTWSQKLDSTNGSTNPLTSGCGSDRFECIWYEGLGGPQAVLDKETGLVWERSPASDQSNWIAGSLACIIKKVGGRFGWRLPSVHELFSLIDDTTDDKLPDGHPFTNTQSSYWTSTTVYAGELDQALGLSFNTTGSMFGILPKTLETLSSWCVRGGNSYDALKQ